MPGVHGLEHIQGFAGPDLPQDDALRPHPQGVFNQVPLGDLPGTLQVGGPGFQADHVLLLHLEFGRVFDGDDALVIGDEAGQDIEEHGLAGTGARRRSGY